MSSVKALKRLGGGIYGQVASTDQIACDAGAMTLTETGSTVSKALPDAMAAKVATAALTSTEFSGPSPAWAIYSSVTTGFGVNIGGFPITRRTGGNQVATFEAIVGMVNIPPSANNPLAVHSSGVSGYAWTANAQQGAVALFTFAGTAADNCSAWADNKCVTNASDLVNNAQGNKDGKGSKNFNLWGSEYDFEIVRPADGSVPGGNLTGIDLVGASRVQPAGNVVGIRIQPHGLYTTPQPTPWKNGIKTEAGATITAISVGQASVGSGYGSQIVEYVSTKSDGTVLKHQSLTDPTGVLLHIPPAGGAFVFADSSSVSRFAISDAGIVVPSANVGVGVTSPSLPLQVRRDSATWQVAEIANLNAGAAALLKFTSNATPLGMEFGAHPTAEGFLWRVKGNARLQMDGAGNITPGTDAAQSLGSGSLRLGTIYASTGTIQTSDGTAKVKPDGTPFVDANRRLNIAGGEIPEAVLDAWERVTPVAFRYADAIAAKGDKARTHFGYIAQDVAAQFKAAGLDAYAFGLVGYDAVIEEVEEVHTVVERRPVMVEEAYEAATTFIDENGFAVTRMSPDVRIVQATKAYPVLGSDGKQATKPNSVLRRDQDGVPMMEEKPTLVRDYDKDGVPIPGSERKGTRLKPIFDTVFEPVWHYEPLFEEVEVETLVPVKRDTGRKRLNLRYDLCAVIEGACQRRRWLRLTAA